MHEVYGVAAFRSRQQVLRFESQLRRMGVPVSVVRLCQTFGPGVAREDGRVFAYMARCALAGENIRLRRVMISSILLTFC